MARARVVLVLALLGLVAMPVLPAARAASVTNAADDMRTGWYPDQPGFQSSLQNGTFGQLFSTPVTGQIFAQPLVSNGTLLVATEANHVYGLNPVTGDVNWERVLGAPWTRTENCTDMQPLIGVTGTPVIDPDSATAYLFSKTYAPGSSTHAVYEAHALDLDSGDERPGFPVAIHGAAPNAPGTQFNADQELQRPGLLLMDGVVYAAFGGLCDLAPYQGWVAGVTTDGTLRSLWNARGGANKNGAGIWQSGGGLVSDGPGRIILVTGNGGTPEPGTPGSDPPDSFGESVVRLQVGLDGALAPADFFAPYDGAELDHYDADFGSGGPMALPDAQFGTAEHRKLMVEVGKQGYVYLLDRDDLGGIGTGPNGSDRVVARIGPDGGVWSRPSVWPGEGYVYFPTASGGRFATTGSTGYLRVYKYGLDGAGHPTLTRATTTDDQFGYGSSATVVTSNGTEPGTGLVWVVWTPESSGVGGQLRAYKAVPSGGKLQQVFSAPVGQASKFTPPGVAAHRIYVGARDGHVLGFGLPVSPELSGADVDFPATTVGETRTRTATFVAGRDTTVNSFESTGAAFTLGTPSRPLPAQLHVGDSISVPVEFAPSHPGLFGGEVRAHSSGDGAVLTLSGSGRSVEPHLTASPPVVSFGGAEVGGSVTGAVTFTNDGGSPLSFDDVELPDAPFEVTGAPAEGSQLASDESTVVTLTFEPSELGDFGDELAVETSGGNKTIGLSGVAAPPGHLEIDPTALHFGAVPLGSELVRHFTLRNTGGLPVRITRSKRPAIPFYTGPELDEGTTIAAGDEEAFAVRFAPPGLGDFASRWQLNSDDGQGQRLVTFDGSGVPAPVEAPVLPIPAPLAALTSRKASPPPRLALRLTRLRSRRVRIRLAGADTALVARAGVYVDGRRIGALLRPRLARAVRVRGAGRHRVAVRVLLADGRTQWLRRTLRGL